MADWRKGLKMGNESTKPGLALGAFLFAGLVALGLVLGRAALKVKALERKVVVKGLSEREMPADIAIWPITFQEASNDLNGLFETVQEKNEQIVSFIKGHGLSPGEITTNPPSVVDLHAQRHVSAQAQYRYTASSTITVYSSSVEAVRKAMSDVITLGKQGIALAGDEYRNRTRFLFQGLVELKPGMIEEATRNARQVAEKFAEDSESKLGKIKSARQGTFSIRDRDSTTPHLKMVRVVSTVEYYLSD